MRRRYVLWHWWRLFVVLRPSEWELAWGRMPGAGVSWWASIGPLRIMWLLW
jgi:hypothetical protein